MRVESGHPSNLLREATTFDNLRSMGNLIKVQKDLRSSTISILREVINQHFMLAKLQKEVQDLLITHLNFYILPANNFLYKQNESFSDQLFILIDGTIIKYQNDLELGTFEAPYLFGDEALFHNQIRDHSVASGNSEIKICAIQRKKFHELVRFVSPQHCKQVKDLFEKSCLFVDMEPQKKFKMIQKMEIIKVKKG